VDPKTAQLPPRFSSVFSRRGFLQSAGALGGQVITGLQLRTSAEHKSADMGAAGILLSP